MKQCHNSLFLYFFFLYVLCTSLFFFFFFVFCFLLLLFLNITNLICENMALTRKWTEHVMHHLETQQKFITGEENFFFSGFKEGQDKRSLKQNKRPFYQFFFSASKGAQGYLLSGWLEKLKRSKECPDHFTKMHYPRISPQQGIKQVPR